MSRPIFMLQLSLFSALIAALGCSASDVGRVTGKVTLDGQPLSTGTIVFEDATHGIAVSAPLKADGSYEVRTHDKAGLPAGDYRVSLSAVGIGSGETPLVSGPPDKAGPPKSAIPEKYRDAKSSGLTAKVATGTNKPFDFALSSK